MQGYVCHFHAMLRCFQSIFQNSTVMRPHEASLTAANAHLPAEPDGQLSEARDFLISGLPCS